MKREAWAAAQAVAWFVEHAPKEVELAITHHPTGIVFWAKSEERQAGHVCTFDALRSGEENATDVVARLAREVQP